MQWILSVYDQHLNELGRGKGNGIDTPNNWIISLMATHSNRPIHISIYPESLLFISETRSIGMGRQCKLTIWMGHNGVRLLFVASPPLHPLHHSRFCIQFQCTLIVIHNLQICQLTVTKQSREYIKKRKERMREVYNSSWIESIAGHGTFTHNQ